MIRASLDSQIQDVRAFNRFYTQQIGLLQEGLLQSPFSLTQARVLFELASSSATEPATSVRLCETLGLDRGYCSRLLRKFESDGLVSTTKSKQDGRVGFLHLTPQGRKVFKTLNRESEREIAALMERMPEHERPQLVTAMRTIQRLLSPPAACTNGRSSAAFELRDPAPGDIGWVVSRHGAIYAQEYQWDATFEALVAEIAGKFVREFKPGRERAWIAWRGVERLGCVFVVEDSKQVARLRLLLVEPSARGLGLGKTLVRECIEFARNAGYKRMTLWTNDVLAAARAVYVAAGFRLVKQKRYTGFGQKLVSQDWELTL